MNSAMYEVQKAIYETLKNDTTLSSMITNIYDYVPKNAKFPYITLVNGESNKWNTFDKQGKELNYIIDIVSQYTGFELNIKILDVIVNLLDYKDIPIENSHLVYIRYDDAIKNEEKDGLTKIISATFSVIVQEV